MTISRQKLYAHGEPFGDSCTRMEPGRRLVCGGGGGGGSSSSSSTTQNSYAQDSRMALGAGAIGATSGGMVSVDFQDPGALRAMELAMLSNNNATESAIKAAQESSRAAAEAMEAQAAAAAKQVAAASAAAAQTSSDAFGFASSADATNKQGFSKLLDTSFDMFALNTNALSKAFDSTAKTQELTAMAYQSAEAEKKGTIDNKTIMVIAIAGAAALVMVNRKK